MTAAIDLLIRHKVPHTVHRYQHDPGSESYGLEAADKLAVPVTIFKSP